MKGYSSALIQYSALVFVTSTVSIIHYHKILYQCTERNTSEFTQILSVNSRKSVLYCTVLCSTVRGMVLMINKFICFSISTKKQVETERNEETVRREREKNGEI